MRISTDRGIAMVTAMLVLMLMSALLVGFTTVVMTDQRYRFIDRDRGQAFYGAVAGIEKLTADLGNLFFTNVAPTGAQVTTLTADTAKPVLDKVEFSALSVPDPLPASSLSSWTCLAPKTITTVGTNGYTIKFCADAAGRPTTVEPPLPIKTGPYEGLIALQTPYQPDVTARTKTGGEVHLARTIESVAIPVFQFGMFSDVDLEFFAAADFAFGGRVHTNGNLFLAHTSLNATMLSLSDKVTAVKEVVRQRLSNRNTLAMNAMNGTVRIWTGSAWRNLAATEGSVTDGLWPATTNANWQTISLSYYNSRLRNSATGAKALSLPLTMVGGSNPDLVRRPAAGENVTNSILFGERLFSRASLRVLLSDTAADITGLPTVTPTAPVSLDGNWNTAPPGGYGPVSSTNPPVALSPGTLTATTSGVAGPFGGAYTINFASAAAAAPFKPKFYIEGFPGTTISCTDKGTVGPPFQLTGCTTTPVPNSMPVTLPPQRVKTVSVAGGSGDVRSGPTSLATNPLDTTISFGNAADTAMFVPLPFWNGNTLITCTGFTATSYTGCSSNPPAGTILRSYALSNPGIGLLGGFIKIERQAADGTWTDVTMQILNYGIGAPNLGPADALCADPTPNAIIRLQRLRDNGDNGAAGVVGGGCNYNTNDTGAKDPANWWPLSLYDTRESVQRDADPGYPAAQNLTVGGVMYYITLDAGNLTRWFRGVAPYGAGSGPGSKTDNNGYTVYFSDRRNNRNALSAETGEYGWEDFVNPGVALGAPNATLDGGEDVNANSLLDVYGGIPNYNGTYNAAPPGNAAPLDTTARPNTTINRPQAQVNRPLLFRRALKLTNGATIGDAVNGVPGLTIASENPVYIQGDWNANAAFTDPHAATSVIADAVSLLSGAWIDNNSFASPYVSGGRPRAANSWYRVAILGGKGPAFQRPAEVPSTTTLGTDGGAHNFLRMLEGGAGTTVHYRGSMATFYYNRQANGTFKCCSGTPLTGIVYSVPTRDFVFDADFLDPAKLPPNTPVFRDMNAVGFSQELRPGK